MKHFCYITGVYPRNDGLMFLRQGRSLVKTGFKVTYIVCDNLPNETVDGINIISTNYVPKGRWDRFFNTKKHIKKLMLEQDADIYQISDPEFMSFVSILKDRGKKVIFNLREYYPDLIISSKPYIPRFFRKPLSYIVDARQKFLLRKYDAVFTVTDWILEIIRNRYGVECSYLLTNYPIVNNNYKVTWEDYNSRADCLCYEGTIYKVSRQEKVFDALLKTPNVTYLLAGKLEEKYEWIKDHTYWSHVEFVDGFKIEDLPFIFGRSTISNVFRDFEGREGSLGIMKVFESMEAGLPVLFADVPVYQKINSQYNCGLCVDPNDSVSIYNAIKYLVENKYEAYEMGQRGRQAVLNEFNWDKQAEIYISVINSLLY